MKKEYLVYATIGAALELCIAHVIRKRKARKAAEIAYYPFEEQPTITIDHNADGSIEMRAFVGADDSVSLIDEYVSKLGYKSERELNKQAVVIDEMDDDEDDECPPSNAFDNNNGFGTYEIVDFDDFGEHIEWEVNTVCLFTNGVFTTDRGDILDDEDLRPLIGTTDSIARADEWWYVNVYHAIYLENETLQQYTEVLLEPVEWSEDLDFSSLPEW